MVLTNVENAGGGRGCARPCQAGSAQKDSSICSQGEVEGTDTKGKTEVGLQGQGRPQIYPILFHLPHSRSNRCGKRPWAVIVSEKSSLEKGLKPQAVLGETTNGG